jgi:hypothetical protein
MEQQITGRRPAIETICDLNEDKCDEDERCYWTPIEKADWDEGPGGECNIRQAGGFDRYLMAFKK